MPNRILKESICDSENIDTLSEFSEIFFYRLIVQCDDYGRMDARVKLLKSKLFPLRTEKISDKDIEDALAALVSAGLIRMYVVDGKPYLEMKTWGKHQQIRAHKSKYPKPEDGEEYQPDTIEIECNQNESSDINCYQMQSDEIKCSRNPIQKESNPNNVHESQSRSANGTRSKKSDPCEGFAEFYAIYPRKQAKQDAIKAWNSLSPDAELREIIFAALNKQKNTEQWKKDGGQFVPLPASWIRGRRWEDQETQIDNTSSETESLNWFR